MIWGICKDRCFSLTVSAIIGQWELQKEIGSLIFTLELCLKSRVPALRRNRQGKGSFFPSEVSLYRRSALKKEKRAAMSSIFGNGVRLDETVLDYLWQRQNITADNIANVDTPDYKAQYMTFENVLAEALKNASAQGDISGRSVGSAIDSVVPVIQTTNVESSRLDGNNVDMDQEQVQLVKTAYEYQYLAKSISNELKRLDTAAKTF